MARAQFQKGQKVWVECVGAWAHIEKVQPVWAKGFDEPVRVTYDVGLGREFQARLITAAPRLMALAERLMDSVAESPDDAPPESLALAREARAIFKSVTQVTVAPVEMSAASAAPGPVARVAA